MAMFEINIYKINIQPVNLKFLHANDLFSRKSLFKFSTFSF